MRLQIPSLLLEEIRLSFKPWPIHLPITWSDSWRDPLLFLCQHRTRKRKGITKTLKKAFSRCTYGNAITGYIGLCRKTVMTLSGALPYPISFKLLVQMIKDDGAAAYVTLSLTVARENWKPSFLLPSTATPGCNRVLAPGKRGKKSRTLRPG